MTVMNGEDPALPDDVDAAETLIACLSDDAELLRRANPECEIAANMEAAADMIEALRATEIGARHAYSELILKKVEAEAEAKHLRGLLDDAHAQIRRQAALMERAPLTLAKLRDLSAKHFGHGELTVDDVTLIRAAERAHGIGV